MFEDIVDLLQQVVDDRTVPRNIREKCKDSIEVLKNEKESVPIRINTAVSYLDEAANDPNIPLYTRTLMWNIVSLLESKQK